MTVIDLATDVRSELARLIAPVTPGSIVASSLNPTRNKALFAIALCAVASFAIFIIPIVYPPAADGNGKSMAELWQIIGGAGMGSSFYALHTARSYIETSTFEPRYNNTYLIRLVLGILSGLILAYFLKDFVPASKPADGGPDLRAIGVSTLALIGGFAAEAVVQLLNRIGETLVALVSGGNKEKNEAVKQKAEADALRKSTDDRVETISKLQGAMNLPTPAEQVTEMKKVIETLLKQK